MFSLSIKVKEKINLLLRKLTLSKKLIKLLYREVKDEIDTKIKTI